VCRSGEGAGHAQTPGHGDHEARRELVQEGVSYEELQQACEDKDVVILDL
jgi:hypothetical protein